MDVERNEIHNLEKRIAALEEKAKEQRSLSILKSLNFILLVSIIYIQGSRITELAKQIAQLTNIAVSSSKSIDLLTKIIESLIKSI